MKCTDDKVSAQLMKRVKWIVSYPWDSLFPEKCIVLWPKIIIVFQTVEAHSPGRVGLHFINSCGLCGKKPRLNLVLSKWVIYAGLKWV